MMQSWRLVGVRADEQRTLMQRFWVDERTGVDLQSDYFFVTGSLSDGRSGKISYENEGRFIWDVGGFG
jgi:hypothetical protein